MKLFIFGFPTRYGSIDPQESQRIPQWPEEKTDPHPNYKEKSSYYPQDDLAFLEEDLPSL